jgi:phosphoenolpyruvate-protein kinase (PTS system EI component)
LIDASASEAIISIRERKEILSELGKAKLSDYMVVDGDTGSIAYNKDSKNARAVHGLKVKRETFTAKNGAKTDVTTTSIKLVNPVQAIHELNKMEGAHAAEKHELSGDIGLTFEGREDGTKPPKPPAT